MELSVLFEATDDGNVTVGGGVSGEAENNYYNCNKSLFYIALLVHS